MGNKKSKQSTDAVPAVGAPWTLINQNLVHGEKTKAFQLDSDTFGIFVVIGRKWEDRVNGKITDYDILERYRMSTITNR